jgi:acetyl-CoA synthetase
MLAGRHVRGMTWHLTVPGEPYEAAREQFSWDVPDGYNAAWD